MSYRGLSRRAAGALGILVIASGVAHAGGFALREQSAYGQGASFAGIAAGGALSSMFWNPATITQFNGITSEQVFTGVLPRANQTYTNSALGNVFGGANPAYRNGVDNSGMSAFVPSGYTSLQINDRLWVGLSVNAPFGLAVSFPRAWAGALYGQSADIKSYNFQPVVAYKVNDMLSVAVGLQAQYMKVSYDALAAPFPAVLMANLSGSSWNYGFTVGATLTPWAGTSLGIGYRSAIDQKINGTLVSPTAGSTPGSISTTLALPDMVTVGLRQKLWDPRWTFLAGFEWSDWSRIGTSTVLTPAGTTATISGNPVVLPFQYSDGYFYSGGLEYTVDPNLTLRGGIAFEKSPITDQVRTPRLPDNDRMWYSAGLSYKPPQFSGVNIDLGYSFIQVKDTPLALGPGTGNPWSNSTAAISAYTGDVSSHIHIFSLGVRIQLGAPAPVVTKG
jgi:long-chain fatty acid transport protein